MFPSSSRLRLLRVGVGLALLAAMAGVLGTTPVDGQGNQSGEPQVLTRGPIHEAFAEPVTFDAKPGVIVPKNPPPLVEEVPPEQKPDGDNVDWVPGYWHWEDDRKDFIWISGFWRVLPPNRKWIPGYWNNLEGGGSQWVGGYWANADQGQAEYLPAPPATLENGAPTQAPSENHVWTPGTWVWQETRYLWRPGFWIVAQPGWIWTPAHYVWTPCGYVYVDGGWDLSIRRRGVIFAPCYWSAWTYRPVYVYRPTVCIDVDIVTDHFFCRTGYSSYYFGDYYGDTYVSLGFTPWFRFHYARGGGYCPVYAYHAWYYRSTPNWRIQLQVGYDRCFRQPDFRPPRTYIAQQNIINNVTINKTVVNNNVTVINQNSNNTVIDRSRRVVAKPITQIAAESAAAKDAPMRFRKLEGTEIRQIKNQGQETQQLVSKRLDLERQAARQLAGSATNPVRGAAGAGDRISKPAGASGFANAPQKPIKLDLPKTPIVDRGAARREATKEVQRGDGLKVSNQPPDLPPTVRSRQGSSRGNPAAGGEAAGNGAAGTRLNPSEGKGREPDAATGKGMTDPRLGRTGGDATRIVPSRPGGANPPQTGEGDANKGGDVNKGSGRPGFRSPGSGGAGGTMPGSGNKQPTQGSSSGSAGSGGNRPPSGGGNRPPGFGSGGGSSGGGSKQPPQGGSGSSGGKDKGRDKDKGGI